MPDLIVRTALQISRMTPDRPPWIVAPWVAASSITEVVGLAKKAGKTTWVMALVAAVVKGGTFIGEKAKQGPVVYLTEERPVTFKEALQRAGLQKEKSLYILSWHDTLDLSWPAVMKGTLEFCREQKACLLVVDIISQFAGMKGDSENDAGTALEALRPVQEAAAAGLAVIVVRHARKSGGSAAVSGRGSTAFAGAVDVVLAVTHIRGDSRKTMRKIDALSRFSATPDMTFIDRVDGVYVTRESAANAVEMAGAAILGVAPEDAKNAVVEKVLLDAARVKKATGQKAVQELLESGKLVRLGKGVRNSPYKYAKVLDGKKTADKSGRRSRNRDRENAKLSQEANAAHEEG